MSVTTTTYSTFSKNDVSGQYFGDSAVLPIYAYAPTVILGTMLDQNTKSLTYTYHPGADDTWVEKYTSIYYDGTNTLYHPIICGTYPQFHTKLCSLTPKVYTPDFTTITYTATDWTITRTDSLLIIKAPDATNIGPTIPGLPAGNGYQTYSFSASAFKDGVIPKRLILVMQGAGGGGGGGYSGMNYNAGGVGGGGGAGGWAVVVIDVSNTTANPVTITLGTGGNGGDYNTYWGTGSNGGTTSVGVGTSLLTINGGWGGWNFIPMTSPYVGGAGGVGGSIDTSYISGTGITILSSGKGGNGAGGRNINEGWASYCSRYGRDKSTGNYTTTATGISTTLYSTKVSSYRGNTYNSKSISTTGGTANTAYYGQGGGSLFANGANSTTTSTSGYPSYIVIGQAGIAGSDGAGGGGATGGDAGANGGNGGHARVDVYY